MNQPIKAPEGYRIDGQGRMVPLSSIKPLDLARDQIVIEVIGKTKELSQQIAAFKAAAFADIQAFIDLSAEQYGAKLGGGKGNVTLVSFDGLLKIQRAVSDNIIFDERLQAAKALIDSCIHEWSEGADPKILALVNDAFQVDREGKVSTSRVLGLRRLNISDAKWTLAMQAIGDAITVVGSKSYVRMYERDDQQGEWKQISLDVATA